MDLQVCAIIAIVFCVSLISLFFINQKLRGGKSFEDVLAEKRQLAHLVGGSKYAKKAGARKVNDNNNKAGKKENRKERKLKERREQQQESEETPNDSDAGSESHSASSNSPAHSKAPSATGHVEFSDAELIVDEVVVGVQLSKRNKKQQARKHSASAKPILLNKTEPILTADVASPIETANHFEQIHPKDDVEIKKHRDDVKKALTKARKGSPKIEKPIVNEVIAAAAEPSTIAEKFAAAEPTITPKDSPKHSAAAAAAAAAAKDKVNKKKRNDHANLLQHQQQQQLLLLLGSQAEDVNVNVNTVMHLLGRADLSRSEIQIIIDYLLNKQQDTLVDHSDWSDDPLQKLKKQLLEREAALAEEQEASAGLQTKLRELRASINTLSAENRARTADVQQLQAEHNTTRERLELENQRLGGVVQRLQEEVLKQQQQQAAGADASAQLQQVGEANAQLQLEVVQLQQSLQQKIGEYEAKLHENQVLARQRDTEVAALFAQNQAYVDQLKLEVDEQTARAKRLDDSSKVEIRNLQNALDSSNREVNVCAQEANKWRQQHDELKSATEADQSRQVQHTQELLHSVAEMRAQLAERDTALVQRSQAFAQQEQRVAQLQAQIGQQASVTAAEQLSASVSANDAKHRLGQETEKVNELTAKLAEQNATLQGYKDQSREQENRLADLQAQVSQYQDKNNLQQIADQQQQLTDQQQQIAGTRQLLERLFPALSAPPAIAYADWLGQLGQHIEQQRLESAAAASAATAAAVAEAVKAAEATAVSANNVGGKTTNNHHANHQPQTANNHNNKDVDDDDDDDEEAHAPSEGGSSAVADALIMENAKLQANVEQYKTIILETEGILKRLETKVHEQELRLAEKAGQ